jgi:hypothetical protein
VDRKSGPLFVKALGRPLKYRQWKPLWKVAADKASRQCADRWEGVGQAGAHASVVVTPRTYCAPLARNHSRTRSVIGAVIGASADQVRTDAVL